MVLTIKQEGGNAIVLLETNESGTTHQKELFLSLLLNTVEGMYGIRFSQELIDD